MTNIKSESRWALVKKLCLALPFLLLIGAAIPSVQADDYHHGYYRHHRYYRHHHYYHHRHYYYRHGRRYYGPRSGVNVNIGL